MYVVNITNKHGTHSLSDFADVAHTMTATISEALYGSLRFIEAYMPHDTHIEIVNCETGRVVCAFSVV